jgi:hypothetical protein
MACTDQLYRLIDRTDNRLKLNRKTPVRISGVFLRLNLGCLYAAVQVSLVSIILVETAKVHDFIPHRYKVVQELLLGVLTCIDFRQGPELGVRTED